MSKPTNNIITFCIVSNKFNIDLYIWSIVGGVKRWDDDKKIFENKEEENDPMEILNWFKKK